MASEDVTYILDAEDRASAKIRKNRMELEASAKATRDFGVQAKASTELTGSFAAALGDTAFSSSAAQIAQLTERVSAFTEVARKSTVATIALKGAVVGLVAVGGFQLGQTLAAWVTGLDDLEEAMDRGRTAMQKWRQEQERFVDVRFGQVLQRFALEGPEREQELLEQEIKSKEKLLELDKSRLRAAGARLKAAQQLDGLQANFEGRLTINDTSEAQSRARADAKIAQQGIDRLERQLTLLRERTSEQAKAVIERRKELELQREQEAAEKRRQDEVKKTNEQWQKFFGNLQSQYRKFNAQRQAAQFPNFIKQREEAAKQAREQRLKQIRAQREGLEEELRGVNRVSLPTLTGRDDRLGSGRGNPMDRLIAEENRRAAKREQQLKAQIDELKRIERAIRNNTFRVNGP